MPASTCPGGSPHFRDVNDIFAAFGDLFGDSGFGDLFGGGGGRGGRRAGKGADVRAHITLDLIEAARGVTKTVEFEGHEKCDDYAGSGVEKGTSRQKCGYCGGKGQVIQSTGIFRVQTTCPSCHGAGSTVKEACSGRRRAGYVQKTVRRDVAIPAGIDDQMRVRLPGEGEPSAGWTARRLLLFYQHQRTYAVAREGQHLVVRMPLTYSQLALGCELEVPTLDGPEEITIPAGTQSGEVFKLRDRGLPHPLATVMWAICWCRSTSRSPSISTSGKKSSSANWPNSNTNT